MSTERLKRILGITIALWFAWLFIGFSLTNGFDRPMRFFKRELGSLIGFILVIYINVAILLPTFHFNKKPVLYFLFATLLLISTVVFLNHDFFPWAEWLHHRPNKEGPINRMFKNGPDVRWMREFVPLLIALLGSSLVEISRFANMKEKEAIGLEKEKLETELKFLKSQVNPHFLFNALNNIYSLAVSEAPQTPETVMQLSEVLRYMVYDSNEPKVLLKNEIKYIQNFVDLHRLKDSKGMNIEMELDIGSKNLMVAPLLFIPFVENAIKHSQIENRKDGFIKIHLSTSDKGIEFKVSNSIPSTPFTKDKVGGVGLTNIKKRLHLLYPGNLHELELNETKNRFDIVLKIIL